MWECPAEIAVQVSLPICTGVIWIVFVVTTPSWPLSLSPHAKRSPPGNVLVVVVVVTGGRVDVDVVVEELVELVVEDVVGGVAFGIQVIV